MSYEIIVFCWITVISEVSKNQSDIHKIQVWQWWNHSVRYQENKDNVNPKKINQKNKTWMKTMGEREQQEEEWGGGWEEPMAALVFYAGCLQFLSGFHPAFVDIRTRACNENHWINVNEKRHETSILILLHRISIGFLVALLELPVDSCNFLLDIDEFPFGFKRESRMAREILMKTIVFYWYVQFYLFLT